MFSYVRLPFPIREMESSIPSRLFSFNLSLVDVVASKDKTRYFEEKVNYVTMMIYSAEV